MTIIQEDKSSNRNFFPKEKKRFFKIFRKVSKYLVGNFVLVYTGSKKYVFAKFSDLTPEEQAQLAKYAKKINLNQSWIYFSRPRYSSHWWYIWFPFNFKIWINKQRIMANKDYLVKDFLPKTFGEYWFNSIWVNAENTSHIFLQLFWTPYQNRRQYERQMELAKFQAESNQKLLLEFYNRTIILMCLSCFLFIIIPKLFVFYSQAISNFLDTIIAIKKRLTKLNKKNDKE